MAEQLTRYRQRIGTASAWTSANPTLASGELGFESDTRLFKIGDGSTAWASLPYSASGGGVSDHGALTGLDDDDHSQYHNDARGDARYSQLGHDHAGVHATAAQGATADTAVQPGDLGTVATSNSYDDLDDLPTLGSAAATDSGDYATAAQGALADSAAQPADVSSAVSTHAALTETHGISAFGATLVDDADAATARTTLGLGTAATTAASAYATAAQGTTADSALQPSDIASGTITARADDIDFSGGSDGDVLTVQADGSLAMETPSGGGGSSNTRWIGAGEFIPRVTNGAGIDGEETATHKVNLDYLSFDPAIQEYAQASFAWPSGFTTFTATFHWTAASGSGGVRWQCSARCYADDDALDQAQGTAQGVTDTLLAAGDEHRSSATSAITPAGTVSAGNLCVIEISRDVSHGDDDIGVPVRPIGVYLEFSA